MGVMWASDFQISLIDSDLILMYQSGKIDEPDLIHR